MSIFQKSPETSFFWHFSQNQMHYKSTSLLFVSKFSTTTTTTTTLQDYVSCKLDQDRVIFLNSHDSWWSQDFHNKNLKILRVNSSSTLDWTFHVNKAISSANSLTYAFQYIHKRLSTKQFSNVIHAYFISKLTFCSLVWSIMHVDAAILNTPSMT